MPVVPATHQCCVESGRLADFKTKFVIAKHATGRHASTKLLRFVSDDIWDSRGVCRVISRSIAEYLVQAWDVSNNCKHNGAVLPFSSAPEGRGADSVDAMA
jgi:hypothetical protein